MTLDPGLHLRADPEDADAIDDLARRCAADGGGRVGLDTLVGDLDRRARRTPLPVVPLPAVRRAWSWDATDRRDPRWWPQGVTTSADADPSGRVAGRHLVLVAWYAKQRSGDPKGGQGVRVSVFDPARRRYAHVLLVAARGLGEEATGRPLRVHAGGLAWTRSWLHVAATRRGFASARLDDLLRVPEGPLRAAYFGYRFLLPVRIAHRAGADDGVEPLRYSFFSHDRGPEPGRGVGHESGHEGSGLVVGEYARGRQSRRLARFALDGDGLPVLGQDGLARPVVTEGVAQMQGVVRVRGTYVATSSRGPWGRGSVWSGTPGTLHEHRTSLPMGPEDLAHDPGTDLLWTATEHPRRRWVCALDASRFA